MTIHPCFFPTLFVAAVSVAAASALRRSVRKEYASLIPWLTPWSVLCSLPALTFAVLCLPPFADAADRLNAEIAVDMFKNTKFTGDVSHWVVENDYDDW